MTKRKITELETKEEILERHAEVIQRHNDHITGLHARIEALHKLLSDHRKAKTLANKRADDAVAAMKLMLEKFSSYTE